MWLFYTSGKKALHANLQKMPHHHKYVSKDFNANSEQWYWEIHLEDCFLGQLFFENIPDLKGSCKGIFILKDTDILHFLPWRQVKEEENFMDFLKKTFWQKV